MLPRVAFAQDLSQPLPIDPQVRTGQLENGLTYFIRHNEQPKEDVYKRQIGDCYVELGQYDKAAKYFMDAAKAALALRSSLR